MDLSPVTDSSTRQPASCGRSLRPATVVPSWLQALGLQPKEEHITKDRLFAIDVALRGPSAERIAVQVDGQSHFSRNEPFVLSGETEARNRALSSMGWHVVTVPWHMWLELDGPDARRRWLRGELEAAVR